MLVNFIFFNQHEVAAKMFPVSNIYHSYAIKLTQVKKVTFTETEE
jgi:hypothetical protein